MGFVYFWLDVCFRLGFTIFWTPLALPNTYHKSHLSWTNECMYVTDVYFVSVFPGSCSPTVQMNMDMHHDHHDHGTMLLPRGQTPMGMQQYTVQEEWWWWWWVGLALKKYISHTNFSVTVWDLHRLGTLSLHFLPPKLQICKSDLRWMVLNSLNSNGLLDISLCCVWAESL